LSDQYQAKRLSSFYENLLITVSSNKTFLQVQCYLSQFHYHEHNSANDN